MIRFRNSINAIAQNRSDAQSVLNEEISSFKNDLQVLFLKKVENYSTFKKYQEVLSFFQEFYRNQYEIIPLFKTIAQYPIDDYLLSLHQLFQELIIIANQGSANPLNSEKSDLMKFLVQEMLMYLVTVLLENEQFQATDLLLRQKYTINSYIEDYTAFTSNITLNAINHGLDHQQISLQCSLLKNFCNLNKIDFVSYMQSDFILFLRSRIENIHEPRFYKWYPHTFTQFHLFRKPFTIFAKSNVREFFNKMKVVLSVSVKEELEVFLNNYTPIETEGLKLDKDKIKILMNFDSLCLSALG